MTLCAVDQSMAGEGSAWSCVLPAGHEGDCEPRGGSRADGPVVDDFGPTLVSKHKCHRCGAHLKYQQYGIGVVWCDSQACRPDLYARAVVLGGQSRSTERVHRDSRITGYVLAALAGFALAFGVMAIVGGG